MRLTIGGIAVPGHWRYRRSRPLAVSPFLAIRRYRDSAPSAMSPFLNTGAVAVRKH
jgi:hypothetical protein